MPHAPLCGRYLSVVQPSYLIQLDSLMFSSVTLQAEQAAVARTSELSTVRRTLEIALSVARKEAEASRKEVMKVGDALPCPEWFLFV